MLLLVAPPAARSRGARACGQWPATATGEPREARRDLLLGGQAGVGLARRLDDRVLRWLVVAFGLAVGMALLIG